MDGPGTVNARARRARRALLVAAGLLLFFWRLGSHDLWPPDEPRFALVAKEMWMKGDYAVLSLNDRLYTDKPPLFFWAINGFGRLLGGIDEWAARLPSALSTVLAMLLIERLGARLYDPRTGLLGALVFATSLQILERGRWASIDMTLTLFVLSAIALFRLGRDRPDRQAACFITAWGLMGLATLAKGPVGLVLPVLAALPSALLERDWRAARRMFDLRGVALYLLITLSWFGIFAWRLGLDHALWVLMHQNVDRYVGAWNATHPVWYYLWRFPVGFFPWIVFLPWGIAQALSREESDRRGAALFLLTWIAAIFLFFSFSTGKRGVYIIPLYPAAAILVGRLLARAGEPPAGASEAGRRLRAPLLLWAGVALLLPAALPVATSRHHPELAVLAGAIGFALAAGAAAAAVLHLRRRTHAAVACVIGSLLVVAVLATEGLYPWVNRHENIRGFAEQARARLEPGARFATSEEKRDAWVFYTGRFAEKTDTPRDILEYLSRDGPRYLMLEDDLFRTVDLAAVPGVVEVLRGRVAGQEFRLLRKEAPP